MVVLVAVHAASPAAASESAHAMAPCPPEAGDCAQMSFPCPAGDCSVALAPVSDLGTTQAVYVTVNNLAIGDVLGLGFCSLSQGAQVESSPTCASEIQPPPGCQLPPPQSGNCPPTTTPSQWTYARALTNSTNFTIGSDFDPAGQGAKPIVSDSIGQPNNYTSFNCDNGPASPCGLYVMDIPPLDYNGPGYPPVTSSGAFAPSTENTVVVPLSWAPSATGCNSSSTMLVDAAYSMQQFLPAAGAATCNAPGGVTPVGTSIPSVDDSSCGTAAGTFCPIQDVIDGNVPVTFTDDPEDPGTQAALKQAGGQFAFIPIAVSATELAFLGGPGEPSGAPFPLNTYDLTPAMAAGVLTQSWASPVALTVNPEDDVCKQLQLIKPCREWITTSTFKENVETVNGSYADVNVSQGATPHIESIPFFNFGGNYANGSNPGTEGYFAGQTGFALLNPWPLQFPGLNQDLTEGQLGATFPSTGSGTLYQLTDWLCASSKTVPYAVTLPWSGGAATVQDILTGQQVLADSELGPVEFNNGKESTFVAPMAANAHKCETLSTLPQNFANVPASNKSGGYQPAISPLTAAHTLQTFESNNSGGGFDFSSMDSSEADYFGLYPAALENAAGQFVLPNQASIDAGVGDATPNPDGTLSPNFATSDPNAYPLPMVSYALVSTGPQPAGQASQLKSLLTSLVNYSHTAGAGTPNPLPAGYVPLPDSLYQAALTDISKDIVGPAGSGAGSGGGAGTAGGLLAAGGSPGGQRVGPLGLLSALAKGGLTGTAGSSGVGSPGGQSGGFVGRLISVSVGPERFFVPFLLLLALLCLIAGPLLYMYPNWRKSRADSHALAAAGLTTDGPTPADTGPGSDP
jgi:hypothetical protein